mmetsp:Transcript_53859/g.143332  ORF Transcript_53859/g.143332 Transcript_53859/m.143332 type:complete len:682 (-) Transcript_53859:115-2160(-)
MPTRPSGYLSITALRDKSRISASEISSPRLPAVFKAVRSDAESRQIFEEIMGGANMKRLHQSGEARGKHQNQVESLNANVLVALQEMALDNVAVVELGAGKALLGAVISRRTGLPLIAIDRRKPGKHSFDARTTDTHRVEANVDSVDVAALMDDMDKGRAVLVAKHLCAGASDVAVKHAVALTANSRLRLLALAPCCHHKLHYEEWTADDELKADFGDPELFAILRDLNWLASCVGTAGGRQAGGSTRWVARRVLGDESAIQMGRLARRVIEEGRIRALQAAGLEVVVLEYASRVTTPDNILILAAPRDCGGLPPVVGHSPPPVAGVLLQLDPDSPPDTGQRVLEYVLCCSRRFPTVTGAELVLPPGRGGYEVLLTGLECLSILHAVRDDPVLGRSVVRMLPFEGPAGQEEVFCRMREQVEAEHHAGSIKAVRIAAHPRQLQEQILDLFPEADFPTLFQPAQFTHTLSVCSWTADAHEKPLCGFSALGREVWDLPDWRSHWTGKSCPDRLDTVLGPLGLRSVEYVMKHHEWAEEVKLIIVVSAQPVDETAWARLAAWMPTPCQLRIAIVTKGDVSWQVGKAPVDSEVGLVLVSSAHPVEDICELVRPVLHTLAMSAEARVVCRVLAAKRRGGALKKWARETVELFRRAAPDGKPVEIEIENMVADVQAAERTVVMRFDGVQ